MSKSMPVFVTENDTFIFPDMGIKEIYAQNSRGGWEVVATLSGVGIRILASKLTEEEKDRVMAGIASGLLEGTPMINFSSRIEGFLKDMENDRQEGEKIDGKN